MIRELISGILQALNFIHAFTKDYSIKVTYCLVACFIKVVASALLEYIDPC